MELRALIYGGTADEHDTALSQFFLRLPGKEIYDSNLKKCKFDQTELEYFSGVFFFKT